MQLMDVTEAAEQLGMKTLERDLSLRGPKLVTSKTYYLPTSSAALTIVSKTVGERIASLGPCWLQITYWSNDADSNQELFYGYRKGCGDERSLADASVYRFDAHEGPFIASILSLVLYFGWDARIFDADLTYQISVNNGGFLDYESTRTDGDSIGRELSLLGLSELAPT